MILGIDPKVDYAFKWIFGRPQNREILIDAINAVLGPKIGEEVVEVELLNPFNEKDFEDGKLSIVDIKARDQSGRRFNIEMEMIPDRYFSKRLVYYWAKMYTEQLNEGQPYENLKKTVLIAFVNAAVFREAPGYSQTFRMRNAENTLLFTDDFEAHILEIGKFRKEASDLAGPLDAWLYFLKYAEKMDSKVLPVPLRRPGIERAMKELMMLTKEERERYETRLKAQRDEMSRMQSAKLDGLEEGRVEVLFDVILSLAKMLGRPTGKGELANLSVDELKAMHERLLAEVAMAISRKNGQGAEES